MVDDKFLSELLSANFSRRIELIEKYFHDTEKAYLKDKKELEEEYTALYEEARRSSKLDEDLSSISNSIYQTDLILDEINRRSAVFAIYSLLEHFLHLLCHKAREQKHLQLTINNFEDALKVRKDKGISKYRSYLKRVANVDFTPLDSEWSSVKDLSEIRNCLAHCDGHILNFKKGQAMKIRTIIKNRKGLSENLDRLKIDAKYVEDSLHAGKQLIAKLSTQTFLATPADNNPSEK